MFDLLTLDVTKAPDLGTADNLGSYGVTVTLSGIMIVFSMLVLLVVVLIIFGAVMSRISGAPKKEKTPKAPKVKEQKAVAPKAVQETVSDDESVIAAISAAVAMMYEGTGKMPVIRSIRPAVKSARSAWSAAGVMNNTRSF